MRDLVRASILAMIGLAVTCGNARCDELVDAIDKSWRERSKAITSAKIKWNVKTTYVKGGLAIEARMFRSAEHELVKRMNAGLQIPEQDTVVDTRHSITFSGRYVLYDFEEISWSFDKLEYLIKPCRIVCTDKGTKAFFQTGIGDGKAKTGIVRNEVCVLEAKDLKALPLDVHCLPFTPDYDDYSIVKLGAPKTTSVIGSKIRLSFEAPNSTEIIHLECDRELSDCLTSIERVDNMGRPKLSVAIEYQRDSQNGCFPSKWIATRYVMGKPGVVSKRIEAKVEEYVLNDPISASDLEFEFEAGTVVFANSGKEKYLVGKNGERYKLTNEDLTHPYESLLHLLEPKRDKRRDIAALVGIIALFLFGGYILRKRQLGRRKIMDS